MSLNLKKSVHDILKQVIDLTGKGFEFIEKKDLSTHATVKIARESMPAHIVIYKSASDEIVNHLLAHECGHILRLNREEKKNRLIPYNDDSHKRVAFEEIYSDIALLPIKIPMHMLPEIVNIWYQGLIRQLTNMPPDIMIERWIYSEYPDLRTVQMASLKRQHSEAIVGLSKRMKEMTPVKIYDSSNQMNYIFFALISEYLQINLKGAFLSTPYPRRSSDLLRITREEYENSYSGDIEMINRWAVHLQLNGWFSWRDFEDVPEHYLKD